MPLPKPHKGESQSDFMARCMSEAFGSDAPEDRTQEQAVAMCMDAWRSKGLNPAAEVARIIARWGELFGEKRAIKLVRDLEDLPVPEPDESRADFMDRCIEEMTDVGLDEANAEEACRVSWEEQGDDGGDDMEDSYNGILHKQFVTTDGGGEDLEFILSDETPDRFGDVIEVEGWDYKNFLSNPLALFNHNANFPIGTWRDVTKCLDLKIGKSLRSHLVLAPEGTSDRIDEIRRLVKAKILRAVSVGFKPIKSQRLNPPKDGEDPFEAMFAPRRYTKTELVECSLVSIPANPNALAVVKSLHISPETTRLVFAGKHANEEFERRRFISMSSSGKHASNKSDDKSNGKHATSSTPATGKGHAMSGLSERIQEVQKRVVQHTDELAAHLARLDDSNVSDDQMQTTQDLNSKIAQANKTLAMLQESERNLGATVSSKGNGGTAPNLPEVVRHHPGNGRGNIDDKERERRNSFFAPPGSKELKPLDYVVRAGVVTYLSRIFNRSPEEICRGYEPYNDDKTRAVVDWNIRSAVNPAMTTVAGWAAELVTQINADYMGLLQPQSVFPRLSARGLTLSFGRAGRINIPMRSATPTIAGSFVGEGMPIPVRRGAFTSQVLTPKKLAVISSWTKEIDQYSIPAIEGLIREAISDDTSVAIDSVLLDSNPATTIRPAGLLNGVAGQTPATVTAGNTFAAIVADIKSLVNAIVVSTKGNVRSLVFLMNPSDVLSASLIVPPNTGVMPFRDELARGTLVNIPVIDSGTVPAKTVVLVDAADFVTVGGEGPAFDISDSATIHEEDTNPAAIVGGTSPGTAATPVRSLWQTDTLALRMIQRLNWCMRRTGMVSYVSAINW